MAKAVKPKKAAVLPVMIYEVVHTGCIIRLVKIHDTSKPAYEFEYLNRKAGSNKANEFVDKPSFTAYLEDVQKSVDMKCWKQLTEVPTNI